jgi:hypothetical protein
VGNGILRPTTISASSLSSVISDGLLTMLVIPVDLMAFSTIPNAGTAMVVGRPEMGSMVGMSTESPNTPIARPVSESVVSPSDEAPSCDPMNPRRPPPADRGRGRRGRG